MITEAPFYSRTERFRLVPSTNDVVRSWLAEGTPEVCLAVADEQGAGRGRQGRAWYAPPGAGLLLSLGFRPAYLEAERVWRLPALVALAMADAAEAVAGLRDGTIRLKWPNDLVVEAEEGVRKLAGVLGETEGLGTPNVQAIVGIGINGDWPRERFPADLAAQMTSLSEVSGGRPFELSDLLEAFLLRLEPRLLALREGRFDVAGWLERQVTTGRSVVLETAAGTVEELLALGADAVSGALIVADPAVAGGERQLFSGEVRRVRLAAAVPAAGRPGV